MDINLLKKFYQGNCSEEEVQKVISWFSSKEEKEKLLDQLHASWEQFDYPEDEVLIDDHRSDKILHHIQARIRNEAIGIREDQKVRHLNINRFYTLRVAAIILLAVGLSVVMQIFLQNTPAQINHLVISEVPVGQKRTLMLEDGTKITLNAGSKTSYPDQFPKDKREVSLEGEAFFEVARDEARPFTVITGDISTRVMGTSFNIRAYGDEKKIEVAVASGKVKVSQNKLKEDQFLLPGKIASYSIEDQVIGVSDFNMQEVLSWKDGTLYFKDASYEEVKKALERWYGVNIQVEGNIKQEWQFSGTFQQESLDNVLKSIGYVKQFSHKQTGNKIVLTFNK